MIDTLHEPLKGNQRKLRTYRKESPQGLSGCFQAKESKTQKGS